MDSGTVRQKLPKFTALTFDRTKIEASIRLNDTIGWNKTWALHTKQECIWRNPFDPKVVGNLGKGIDAQHDTYVEITSALPQGGQEIG